MNGEEGKGERRDRGRASELGKGCLLVLRGEGGVERVDAPDLFYFTMNVPMLDVLESIMPSYLGRK